ncbi:MAG: hypothetical protein ABI592_00565 [Acidobacteriota bacterium]
MKTSPIIAAVCFSGCAAFALAQHSPAPDRPAEGPLRANPGTGVAPGVHPPAPMDGNRFAPGPPAQQETPAGGRVKTEEKIATAPTPTAGAGPAVTPAPGATPARTAQAAKSPTPGARRGRRFAPRRTPPPPSPAPAATPTA